MCMSNCRHSMLSVKAYSGSKQMCTLSIFNYFKVYVNRSSNRVRTNSPGSPFHSDNSILGRRVGARSSGNADELRKIFDIVDLTIGAVCSVVIMHTIYCTSASAVVTWFPHEVVLYALHGNGRR